MKNDGKKIEIEITERDVECFNSAIAFIAKEDEKWQKLAAEKKVALVQKSYRIFLENIFEEKSGPQSSADALFWLLKEIGYKKGEIAKRWEEVIKHAVCDDSPLKIPTT